MNPISFLQRHKLLPYWLRATPKQNLVGLVYVSSKHTVVERRQISSKAVSICHTTLLKEIFRALNIFSKQSSRSFYFGNVRGVGILIDYFWFAIPFFIKCLFPPSLSCPNTSAETRFHGSLSCITSMVICFPSLWIVFICAILIVKLL